MKVIYRQGQKPFFGLPNCLLTLLSFSSGPDTYRGPYVGNPYVLIPSSDPSAPVMAKPSKFLMRLYASKSLPNYLPDVSVLTALGEAVVPFIDFKDTNEFRKVKFMLV